MSSMIDYLKSCLEHAIPLLDENKDPNKLRGDHYLQLAQAMNSKLFVRMRRKREQLNYNMAKYYGITVKQLLTGDHKHSRAARGLG